MARVSMLCMLALFYVCYNFVKSGESLSICLPENQKALFIFGDSLFDSGNNNYMNATTFLQSNFPPYGESFFNYPSGRFSNGRLIPDFIAEYANLSLIPAYLHPGYHYDHYINGVNFASAGAGALPQTNQGRAIDLKTQALYFSRFSKQLREKVGENETQKLLSSAVYIFSIGGNDYGAPFAKSFTSTPVPYSQQQFLDNVIGNITSVIKDIYNEGGRKFGFVNLLPLHCLPLLRRLINGNKIEDCVKGEATTLARLHNEAFPKKLHELQTQLNGLRYSVTDSYSALLELMENPTKYGFKEVNEACCGGGAYRGDYSCGGKRGIGQYSLCNNVDEYVFFDSLHPSEKAAEHFAKLMWSGIRNNTIESYNLKQLFQV